MKSNLRNEIKSYIVRQGLTMQEVVDLLHDEHGWSDSVSNLSNKLQRESLRYTEAVQLPTRWAMKSSGRKGSKKTNHFDSRTAAERNEHEFEQQSHHYRH